MPPPASHDPQALLAEAPWISALARGLVDDPHDAADLAQSAMMAALERRPGSDRPLRGWLATVLRNLAARARRGSARRDRRERTAARGEALPSAAEVAARLETHQKLVAALARLEEPYRTVLLLRYFDGLPPREIARRSGLPVATVRTRLARGLDRLRGELDERWTGGRSAWMAALIPLARIPGPASAIPLGATVMNAKLVLGGVAAVAAVAAAIAVSSLSSHETPRVKMATRFTEPAPSLASAPPAAGAAEAGRGAAREATTAAAASKPVAAKEEAKPGSPLAIRRVRGKVVDCEGRAVAGISVRFVGKWDKPAKEDKASTSRPEGDPQLLAVTDDDGGFDLDLTARSSGDLEVASERYVTVLAGVVSQGARVGDPVVVVAPSITLAGHVVDERGNPVSEAVVRLGAPEDLRRRFHEVLDFSLARQWTATADPAGRFELARIPQIEGARVQAAREGWVPTSIAEPAGGDQTLVLRLTRPAPAVGAISGQVLDATGAPVERAYVSTRECVVRSDRDGRFQIPGGDATQVTLTAVKEGLLPANQTIRRGADGWPGFVVLRLGGAALSIRGKVIGPDGKPVARADVWLANAHYLGQFEDRVVVLEAAIAAGERGYMVQTGADGGFLLDGLLDQKYAIEAMDPESLFVARSEPVPAGVEDVVLTMPRGEVRESVAGIVVASDGKPMPDIEVSPSRYTFVLSLSETNDSHFAYSGGDSRAVRTDANGRFSLGRLAKEVTDLSLRGDSIVPKNVRIGANDETADMRIVVFERCHLKVELLHKDEAIDGFQVLDGDGRALSINLFEGNGRTTAPWASIRDGVSGVAAVDAAAKTLVLLRERKEVRRLPISLKPGPPTVVRP